MNNRFIVKENNTIREALVELNNVSGEAQSLFVVDDNQQIVGSLSDGDIRRGLISGGNLEDTVKNIMHRDFKFINQSDYDVAQLKAFRERRILMIPILDNERHIVDVINLQKFKSHLPVDAVLMAGGKGERLRPLTEKTPKPLLKVGDKCIIDHNIDRLISYGINHINVTVNYLREQIEEHYAKPHNGVQIVSVREPMYLGTIGSVKLIDCYFNDTILIMNSDLFTNIDFEDFFLHFHENDAEMSVAAIPYNLSIPYGVLNLDGREITSIVEKPTYNFYINAGIYLIKKSVITEIPDNEYFNATDLIETLLSKGKRIIRYPLNGTWIDIGNMQEYNKANDLAKHIV